MNTIHRLLTCFTIVLLTLQTLTAQSSLYERFRNPPEEARPWTFWYWMYGAVSREGIAADLEAMKNAGLGGAYLMPIKSPAQGEQYGGTANQLSPEWWEMVRYSMQVADSLDFKLGMHVCDGFALAGGPWIKPEESMQKVVWTDTIVDGGKIKDLQLGQPESYQGYYEDIALYAFPCSDTKVKEHPVVTFSAEVDTTGGYFRVDAGKVTDPHSDGAWIQYEYPAPVTIRNIEIGKVNNNYQAQRLKVMASDDGINYRFVKQLVPARQGWQDYTYNNTHTLSPTTARFFRFYWNPAGSEPGSEDMNDAKWKPNLKIKGLLLHSEPRIHQWEGKTGLIWRVANQTAEAEAGRADCIPTNKLIVLTGFMKNGKLTTHLPKGKWKLLRMGHTSTGQTNATAGGGKGLECDKFNRAAVRKQFDEWFGMVFSRADIVVAHRVLKYMHVDSWECGSQNWSKDFPTEFKARRRYDLMKYLPLMAGYPVDNITTSEKVLRDVRTTIAELVNDVFYDEFAACAKEYGCRFSAESVAPTMVSDGMLHYGKVDLPMGEFWNNSPTHDKPNDMLDAISGAHIYGKNIVQAEGFTQIRGTWDESPATLKPLLDRNFALGMNKLFFHVFVHNPYKRRPGMTLDGIGLFFQRDQTWWKHGAGAMVGYISRAQALLQYGHPVVDIAVFTGEEMPRRAVLPERLVPFLPGLFGKERVAREKERLANEGVPLKKTAGVTHSANMADPAWVNPLRGYAYDSFNKDALLRLADAKDGRMTLPGGASYKVLVVPGARPMNPADVPLSREVKTKMEQLQRAGVLIPQLPYAPEDFSACNLERDAILPEGIAWTHRSGKEAEIYFIGNQHDKPMTFNASLRFDGEPELWNAVTGDIRPAKSTHQAGRTLVPLHLEAYESVFIVFQKGAKPDAYVHHDTSIYKDRKPTVFPLAVKNWDITFRSLHDLTWKRTELFDWSREADEKVKYYSGTAVYHATFNWDRECKGRIYLDLGEVHDLANVCLNGIDCGTTWTAPYRIDITDALMPGENRLDIEVENTWANALNGADHGKAPFEGIWTNGKYRREDDSLLPAGLLGPVVIRN